jgi:hypothetical protein
MTIPIREWSPISAGHDAGTVLAWDNSQKDVVDMVSDLVNALKVFHPTTTEFTSFIVDTYADENAPARPQVEISFGATAGTAGAGVPASQAVFMFRTNGFGYLKINMLDCPVAGNFLPVVAFPTPAYDNALALRDQIIDDANGWSGRDNTQPAFLKKITYSLNDKLRKQYRLD